MKGTFTYENDDEHVQTEGSDSVKISLLKVVNDSADEKWHGQIREWATNQENDS